MHRGAPLSAVSLDGSGRHRELPCSFLNAGSIFGAPRDYRLFVLAFRTPKAFLAAMCAPRSGERCSRYVPPSTRALTDPLALHICNLC